MDHIQLNDPKVDNQQEFDWLYIEEPFGKTLELPPINNFLEFTSLPLPYHNSIEFKDFEEMINGDVLYSLDYNLPYFDHQDFVLDAKPLNNMIDSFEQSFHIRSELSEVSTTINRRGYVNASKNEEEKKRSGRKKSSAVLEFEEIQKYFDMPITRAAKEMKVGLTVLKKRCRELNIMRWPHRKIKSLKSLINNVKELGLSDEVVMLEEHKRLLEKLPDVELTEETKKLRQACFKANYKKRRSLATH